MATTDFLALKGIDKSYGGTHALRSVDFSAHSGEVHAVVGENGAGKSTLMKILSGATQMDAGEIYIDGNHVDLSSPFHAHHLGIWTVYQEFSLIPRLSVTENILVGRLPTRSKGWVDWTAAHQKAQEILDEIGFGGLDVRQPVSSLSVSFQQVVEIAKVLIEKPKILILDEPSAVLSQDELEKLFLIIRKLRDNNNLVIYISHRLDEVFEIADRITVFKDGKQVGTVKPQETNQSELVKMMVGRELKEIYPQRTPKEAEVILRVAGLQSGNSFHDVSFDLRRGEIVGMFGLVGSGRTQIGRCLFGADPITSGRIEINGKVFQPKSPRDGVTIGIALLTEDRKRDGLVMNFSIMDNMGLASLPRFSRKTWIDLLRLRKSSQKKIKELDIRPSDVARLVKTLSGGNQQKVILAKWLLTEANILILDEPTRGVDVATKAEFYQIMGQLADEGLAILMISSELPEILGMSERVLVMRHGAIVGQFNRQEATEERLLAYAAGVEK
jgi:ABC-type sugar transport system ATPase subunit